MKSKLWIRKALSTCLVVATILTYSMVSLANTEKIAGEILVSGRSLNGQMPVVKVNGQEAQSGRSVFSSSVISTPENASAIINLGTIGKIELAPNTTADVSFSEKGISANLMDGRVSVLSSTSDVAVNIAGGKLVNLKSGESASTSSAKQTDTAKDNDGGSAGLLWALILGGAAVGIIIAATTNNNNVSIGGGSTVISPTR